MVTHTPSLKHTPEEYSAYIHCAGQGSAHKTAIHSCCCVQWAGQRILQQVCTAAAQPACCESCQHDNKPPCMRGESLHFFASTTGSADPSHSHTQAKVLQKARDKPSQSMLCMPHGVRGAAYYQHTQGHALVAAWCASNPISCITNTLHA
jgi:hypothetical protein